MVLVGRSLCGFIAYGDGNTILMTGHEAEVEFATAVRVIADGEILDPVSQLLPEMLARLPCTWLHQPPTV